MAELTENSGQNCRAVHLPTAAKIIAAIILPIKLPNPPRMMTTKAEIVNGKPAKGEYALRHADERAGQCCKRKSQRKNLNIDVNPMSMPTSCAASDC